jgi:hypothetical protein
VGSDGQIYGLSHETVFMIDPETFEIVSLGTPPNGLQLTCGFAMTQKGIYFGGSDGMLWRFSLPEK